MIVLIFVVVLLGTMLIGIPISFSLLISGVALMLYMGIFDPQILSLNLIMGADNFSLLAIPFFLLAGEFMNRGGISKSIIEFAIAIVGHLKGGLGYVVIITALIFAGLSGSAVADAAALGAILIPMLAKAGYSKDTATGLVASGGIIAPIIPPSISLIIFGVTANVSITKLFMAGIVPGILMALSLIICWKWVIRNDNVEPSPRKSLKEVLVALRKAIWALFLPVIILVGLRGGVFTPTEASIVAATYALFISVVVYKALTFKDIIESFLSAARVTSVVMFLTAAAMVSAWLITMGNIGRELAEIMGPLVDHPLLLLLVINFVVFLVGTAMDSTPTILILVPVLMPLITQAGIDPVYFGILFVLNCSIGLLTPPVGTVLNVAAGAGKISLERAIVGVLPFLIALTIVLILLILFPPLILTPLEWFT